MSGSIAYKQYQRTQRIIRTEDNYSGGMMYVNTPLDTGYSRIILNLDLAENGTGLKPRAGLRTFAKTESVTTETLVSDWHSNPPYCITNSVMRRDADGTVKYTDTVVIDRDVYKVGPYSDESSYPITRLTHAATDEEAAVYFDKNKAHCFAWQGDLYHMHQDGLYHFNESLLDSKIIYKHEEVSPRALTPKDAVTMGYNMLSKEPYHFSNSESVAAVGDILGVLPYKINDDDTIGDLALNVDRGEIYLKVYLSVINDPNTLYQYSIQWRESTQGSWEDIAQSDPYDDSTNGVKGSTLYEKGLAVKWELPATNGLPIYVRVLLRMASDNTPLYKIHRTSTISEGTTLGEGTNIPYLSTHGLNFVFRENSYNNFVTPINCSVADDTYFPAGTYLSYCKVSRALLSSNVVALPSLIYDKSSEELSLKYSSADFTITDSTGVTRPLSYLLSCFYTDTGEVTTPGATAYTRLVLPAGVTISHLVHGALTNIVTGSCTITGPAVIPLVCETVDEIVTVTSDFKPSTSCTFVNIYAPEARTIDSTINYTVGAGTILSIGDVLNDVSVYQTCLVGVLEDPNEEGYYTALASSKIAPVTSVVSFIFKTDAVSAVVNYDLTTAKGMCYWKDRLVLWGVASPDTTVIQYQEDSANLLFFSELNDPSYFPYPQNVNTFTEPVLRALPFGDDLLVITATSMHLVMLNEDGLSWTTTQIQSNLRFNEDEMYLVQVVNNMVLFKSGPQFYLLVPSTTNIGNLVVAPITKNIKQIFDNPKNFIKRLFVQLFSNNTDKALQTRLLAVLESKTLQLNTFVDFEHVHITYSLPFSYQAASDYMLRNCHVTVDFLYNTSSRIWKCYLYSTSPGHVLIRKDAVKSGVYISTLLGGGANNLAIQYRMFDETTTVDKIYGNQPDPFSNLHYLDTGLRNQDPAYNKRYREAQLRLANHTSSPLTFYTEYSLDGVVYLPLYAPTVETSTDEDGTLISDLNYDYREALTVTGTPVLTKEINDTLDISGDIPVLVGYAHDATDDVYAFSIEAGKESMLEAPFTLKLRSTILGKGYAPSLKIYSRNTTDFTILDHTWVYRIMNAR